ncbi:hypothetical protein L3Q82_005862 [Scortum barcoo]|uniref:Uncharacterized protein n=1 Tax=Scortum barcoo TaxID=214431 RepID=A0ACB8V6X8_9TELE|nr:hypothetical protein L3Q82_005862 [Scortum barcoo]
MVDCPTDYINFCMVAVVPVRSVCCFANNKPWITSDIKGLHSSSGMWRAEEAEPQQSCRSRWSIAVRLLKACARELGHPLQHIFNLSLGQGRVPHLWKTSSIIPVPKKPHPGELNNFRPVALTSHVMKTMERLLLQSPEATDPPRS